MEQSSAPHLRAGCSTDICCGHTSTGFCAWVVLAIKRNRLRFNLTQSWGANCQQLVQHTLRSLHSIYWASYASNWVFSTHQHSGGRKGPTEHPWIIHTPQFYTRVPSCMSHKSGTATEQAQGAGKWQTQTWSSLYPALVNHHWGAWLRLSAGINKHIAATSRNLKLCGRTKLSPLISM